ncbi:MAG: M43 family zinc metalloprotease [Bacteroidota bacterium]
MRILFFTLAILIASPFFSQEHFCRSTEAQNEWFAQHPELRKNFDLLQEKAIEEDKAFFSNSHSQQRTMSNATFTIPVVFHILHQGGFENISDAQVMDAVSILNRDYRKLNADTANVVASFKTIIGDTKFQFTLATKDPNGNCTNGIIRHWDTNTDWQGSLGNYAYSWPRANYLNIYVVKSLGSGAAGYTYLPGSGIPAAMDAIVILHNYVGSIGTGGGFTSRALTHEVGHWFNLPHTWGGTNQPGVACGNDGVSDTPVTKGFSGCALNNAQICNPNIVENVQNYMDYSYCSHMFTIGQSARMQASANGLTNSRYNLSNTQNLVNTGVTVPLFNCVPQLDMSAPSLKVCSGKTLLLSTYTAIANPTSYSWTLSNGATISSSTTAGANILFSNPGSTTITCVVSNAFGSDSETILINVANGVTQITSTSPQSFEGGNGIPAMWTVENPTTPTVKWEVVSNDGASSGVNSVYIKGENAPANTEEMLITPSYDFKNNPGAHFTFRYAYARATTANKDVFKVQASKDCGGTWKDVFAPANTILAMNSAGTTTATLYPTAAQWVPYNLSTDSPYFTPFLIEENVLIRFYFKEDENGSGFGNRIYLDDINFSTSVGINEITKAIGFTVFPNPSESSFKVNFTLSDPSNIKYQVISLTGAVMEETAEKTFTAGAHEVNVNSGKQLAKGIYFLNFEMNGVNLCKKLIVE